MCNKLQFLVTILHLLRTSCTYEIIHFVVLTPLRSEGADFIVSASRSYSEKDRLLNLTTGATTDVASALLGDPALPERVEILTMSFDSWPEGIDPWNIKNDPLAYKVILDSDAPITIGSGDVCRAHLKLRKR
jgi:inosine-uridine nucleoside N-ribohydrolase